MSLSPVMNEVTQDLDKKYVGTGRDASIKICIQRSESLSRSTLFGEDVVDAILNLAQDLIDSEETWESDTGPVSKISGLITIHI